MARIPLLGLELGVKKSAAKALKKAANILLEKIEENASLSDHSLSDLKNLGHPYARRNPRDIHRPSFSVHSQTDRLVDSLRVNQINQFRIQVGADESIAPYVAHVILGTSTMVGRDFVTGSLREVEEEMTNIVIEGINEGVRDGGS